MSHERYEESSWYLCSYCPMYLLVSNVVRNILIILFTLHSQKNHPGIQPFTCVVCGLHTCTQLLLRKHMKVEHNVTKPAVSPPTPKRQGATSLPTAPTATSSIQAQSSQPYPPTVSYPPTLPSFPSVLSSVSGDSSQPVFPQFSPQFPNNDTPMWHLWHAVRLVYVHSFDYGETVWYFCYMYVIM